MHKILTAILISMLFAELAFGHFYVGKKRRNSELKEEKKGIPTNYNVKNALRKADADLLGIREILHKFARQEEQDREGNPWRQERDEAEYKRKVDAEKRASFEHYASLNSDDERKAF